MPMTRKILTVVAAATGFALYGGASPDVAQANTGSVDTQFERMDTNGDGKISADEHATGAKDMFDRMDADKDGKVTASEMTAAHERVTGNKAKRTDMTAADKIKKGDTDGDGILSPDEHTAGARSMFDKMDTDKDGFLTKS